MTLEECYQSLGGDLAEVKGRLLSVRLIQKFIGRFLEDQSLERLCQAFQNGKREDAFRAAHTLKGLCQNLGFQKLHSSVGRLTEILRPPGEDIPPNALSLLGEVRKDYEITITAIRMYIEEA